MAAFSFVSYFGGKLELNQNYTINEQDLLSEFGADTSSDIFAGTVEFTYGLNPVTLSTSGGSINNRQFTFNLGNLNYGEFIKFRYSVTIGSTTYKSERTIERAVNVENAPDNPNKYPPVRTGRYNLESSLGTIVANNTYIIQEADLLAPFSDDDGDTLAVSTRDGSQAGLPRVTNAEISVVSGSAPNRTFRLVTSSNMSSSNKVGFLYTVSDFLSNYTNNYYTATNGR